MPNKMHILETDPSYVEELLQLKEEQEKADQELQ